MGRFRFEKIYKLIERNGSGSGGPTHRALHLFDVRGLTYFSSFESETRPLENRIGCALDIRKRESRSFVVCLPPPARFGSFYGSVRDNISNHIFPFPRRGNLPLIRPFEEIKKRDGEGKK